MCGRARRAGRVINAYCVSPETRQREGRGGSLKSTKGGKDNKQARGTKVAAALGVSRNVNVVDIQTRVTLRQIGDTNAGRGSSIGTKSDWKTLSPSSSLTCCTTVPTCLILPCHTWFDAVYAV